MEFMESSEPDRPSLLHMITQPIKQLERVKQQPVFGQALVTVIIFYLLGNWLSTLGTEIQVVEEIEGIPEEVVIIIMTVTTFLSALLQPILSVIILSFIYFLCAKVMKRHIAFQQLISLNTHVFVISALGVVINGILIAIFGGDIEQSKHMYTSMGALVHTEGMGSILLGNIELFLIWQTIVSAIGLHIVVGFSKRTSWVVAIGVYVLNISVTLLWHYVTQLLN